MMDILGRWWAARIFGARPATALKVGITRKGTREHNRRRYILVRREVLLVRRDDTLWIADSDQRRWEDDCNRRGVEGLPHPGMSDAFRRYLREFGCVRDGVTRALHRSCRDLCGGELPAHWSAQVEGIPEMAQALNLR